MIRNDMITERVKNTSLYQIFLPELLNEYQIHTNRAMNIQFSSCQDYPVIHSYYD